MSKVSFRVNGTFPAQVMAFNYTESQKREHAELKTWVTFEKAYNNSEWPCKEQFVQVANFCNFSLTMKSSNSSSLRAIIWLRVSSSGTSSSSWCHTHTNTLRITYRNLLKDNYFSTLTFFIYVNWERTHLSLVDQTNSPTPDKCHQLQQQQPQSFDFATEAWSLIIIPLWSSLDDYF